MGQKTSAQRAHENMSKAKALRASQSMKTTRAAARMPKGRMAASFVGDAEAAATSAADDDGGGAGQSGSGGGGGAKHERVRALRSGGASPPPHRKRSASIGGVADARALLAATTGRWGRAGAQLRHGEETGAGAASARPTVQTTGYANFKRGGSMRHRANSHRNARSAQPAVDSAGGGGGGTNASGSLDDNDDDGGEECAEACFAKSYLPQAKLSAERKRLVRDTWLQIYESYESDGAVAERIFELVFHNAPEMAAEFSLAEGASAASLGHLVAFERAIDFVVRNVDDRGKTRPYLRELGARHGFFKAQGFKPTHWNMIAVCLVQFVTAAVERGLAGADYNSNSVDIAWKHFALFVVHEMRRGYYVVLRELRSAQRGGGRNDDAADDH